MTLLTDDDSATLAAALSFVDEYQSPAASDYDECDHDDNQQFQYHAAFASSRRMIHVIEEEPSDEPELLLPLGVLTASDDDLLDQPTLMVGSVDSESDVSSSSSSSLVLPPLVPKQPPLQRPVRSNALIMKKKAAENKPVRWDPNKSRNERKQELIYLRKKVSELEAQLRDVNKKKKPRIASSRTSSSPYQIHPADRPSQALRFTIPIATVQTSNPAVASVWKEIAGRQSDERVKSERENIRLKLVLENQIKIAKSLQKFLNKSTATREIEKCIHGAKGLRHVHPPPSDRTENQIFEDLLSGVDNAYDEIDAVFAANGLARSEIPRMDAKMRTDAAQGMFLEVFANKMLPFDIHKTGAAVWNHFVYTKERVPYRYYYHTKPKNINATEDTIVENYKLEMQVNHTSAYFHVKQVLRRYVEKDRVVVVWRAFYDPLEFSGEPLTGVQFLEKGYIVVKKPTTISGNMSLFQTCYIANPVLTGDLMDEDNPMVGAVTDFVLSATAGNITASHQMVENVLLEQALKNGAL
uniref:M96 mating-specific protein family n=1 Tax=Globisporangium ultimum (strain ATCC 200006 / CBS 805.95 / DAOM BR144) TaxID=431595 RepID=K3W8T9_GLOUD